MRMSRELQRKSLITAKRGAVREILRNRACNAVGIVIYGRKDKIDDRLRKDPKVEHIRSIKGGNSADCIQKVVDAVLMEGSKNKKMDELVRVFFNNPEGHQGPPLFEKGKEIADVINSFENEHFKLRFITSIISVYLNTLNEKAVNNVISAFNKLNNTYDEAGLQFLKQVNMIANKHKDGEKVIEFCDAVSSHSLIICLKQFSENEEHPTLASNFMRKMCELCTILPDEKVARIISLSMFEMYGSVMDNGEVDKVIDSILESINRVAEESKDNEYVCVVAEGAKTIYVNGQKNELMAFFEIVRILPSHVEDMTEAAIGIGQVSKEIGRGKKAEELGEKYITLRGGNIKSRDSKETIGGEFELDAPEETKEESEGDFPVIEEEEESITVSRTEKLEMQLREVLGEGFGDAFEKKAMFVNKDDEFDFCNQYRMIFERIRETGNKLNPVQKKRYLELAEKMFTNMDNDLKFAPVVYSVLGELMDDYPIERINHFVENACRVKNDKLLLYLCNEIRDVKEELTSE